MRFIFLLCCLVCSASLLQAAELRVAISAQDTTGRAQPGVMTFNLDLAQELCRRIRYSCVTVDMPFKQILPAVVQGDIQLGFGNYLKTPERETQVGFSDSIWRASSRLVGKPKAYRRFAPPAGTEFSLDTLHGATVVAVEGSRQLAYLERIAAAQKLKVKGVLSQADGVAMLRKGEADFGLFVTLIVYAYLTEQGSEKLAFVGPPMHEQGLGGSVHIALPKGNEALRLAVNQAMAAMRADGSYHRIVRRSFPFSLD